MPRPGPRARVVAPFRCAPLRAGIRGPSLGGAGPPALGVRRKLLPPTGSQAHLPPPGQRVARIAVARSRRRFGCARKANPRTLAPAEHDARATIKSKSHKRQAQPAAPESSHTHQGQALARRCPSLDARAIPPTIPGLGQKQKQQPKQKAALRAAPLFLIHSHKGTVSKRSTRDSAHARIMLSCECPPGHETPRQSRSPEFARCPLSNGHHQIPNKDAALSLLA
jgi:hypothetical protein